MDTPDLNSPQPGGVRRDELTSFDYDSASTQREKTPRLTVWKLLPNQAGGELQSWAMREP
jgi:hypothetical protein